MRAVSLLTATDESNSSYTCSCSCSCSCSCFVLVPASRLLYCTVSPVPQVELNTWTACRDFSSSLPDRDRRASLLLFPSHASFDSTCLFLYGVPVPAQLFPAPVPGPRPPVSPSLLRTPYFRQLPSSVIDPRPTCEKARKKPQCSSPLVSPPALNLTPPPPRLTSHTAAFTASCLPQLPVLRQHLRRQSPRPPQLGGLPPQYLPKASLVLGGTRPTRPAAACRNRF